MTIDYLLEMGGATTMAMAVAAAVVEPKIETTTEPLPTPSEGIAGKQTQAGGQATTVSAAMEQAPDFVKPDVDTELTKIHSDFNILDTIKRKVKKQRKVKSPVVEHWMIDEAKAYITVNGKKTSSNGVITFTPVSEDKYLVNPYYTLLDMATDTEYYVTEVSASGVVTAEIVTEDGSVAATQATISDGARLILLSSAGYETQKIIAPSTVYPVKETVYLQKQLCNVVVSDYFDQQPKEIPFNEAQQAEAALNDYRHKASRAAWLSKGGRKKVRAQNGNLNAQDAYISKGLYRQFKRKYQLGNKITFNDLINLAKSKTSRFGGSKKAAFVVGSDLLADIQKIDFTMHTDVTQKPSEVWGLACTQIHTVFCDMYLILDIALDECGMSKCGALIDMEQLVRYYIKNEETKKEAVQDEEATRRIITTWDALVLKGYCHIWVDGREVQQDNFVALENISTAATLPTTPSLGDTVYLSKAYASEADGVTYEKDKAYTWDGAKWVLASVEVPTEL